MPKLGQKGIASILIVIFLGVTLAGGYLILRNRLKTTTSSSQTTQPVATPNNETANWKTFTNIKDGYSVSYPQNLLIEEGRDIDYSFMTGKKAKANVITRSREDISTNPQSSNEWFELEITVENNEEKFTPSELVNNYLKRLAPDITPYRSTEIVTKKINDSLSPYSNGEIEGIHALFGYEYTYDVIVQTRNNSIYTFIYTGDNGTKVSEETEKLITQILSTFKLLE